MAGEPIGRAEYEAGLRLAWGLAHLIERLPIGEMVAVAAQAESVGPVVDPTAWRANAGKLAEDLSMLRALERVRGEIRRLRPDGAGDVVPDADLIRASLGICPTSAIAASFLFAFEQSLRARAA